MKLYRNLFAIISFFTIASCNESDFLKEQPLDFKSLGNAYVTEDDFSNAVNGLYNGLRLELSAHEHRPVDYVYGTDVAFSGVPNGREYFGDYSIFLIPNRAEILVHWKQLYKVISNSNVILEQLSNSQLSDGEKRSFEAKAKIFRGVSYLYLGYLFGGVPIELEAVNKPKTDYRRATRDEVYTQAMEDLKFSAENLPGIAEVRDGEVSDLAAYHLLSEAYLALRKYPEAIAAATVVIDNPNTSLMTERFGSRKNEPRDVYWDLFRRNNQNRSSGNTEGIWVFQYELDVPGGLLSSTGRAGCQLERVHCPQPYVFSYRDPTGVNPFLSLGVSDVAGRGTGRLSPTNHFKYTIWKSDWNNDIRNSKYNFIRDIRFTNPKSIWYGQTIQDHIELFRQANLDTIRNFYPFQSKAFTPGNHPEGLYADKELGTLSTIAGSTYTDQYFIRLAETCLLRAEAYLLNSEPDKAAADINVVRDRANAGPVSPGQVNIDYILDERMRELGIEEKRRCTLQRLGLLYDRVSKYCDGNPPVAPLGINIKPYNNLFPIPQSEIESNNTSLLEQNPGY